MLHITVPKTEFFDENTSTFIDIKETNLCLEHSLASISKWEAKWHIPFLDEKKEKTTEQTLDYIKCMTLNKGVDDRAYYLIPQNEFDRIMEYIADPHTATTINERQKGRSDRRAITAERIYAAMIRNDIPFECRKWHLNSLMTLIRVCAAENNEKEKMSKKDLYAQNRAMNRARRAGKHSKG